MGDSFNSDKRGFFARRDEDAEKMDQGQPNAGSPEAKPFDLGDESKKFLAEENRKFGISPLPDTATKDQWDSRKLDDNDRQNQIRKVMDRLQGIAEARAKVELQYEKDSPDYDAKLKERSSAIMGEYLNKAREDLNESPTLTAVGALNKVQREAEAKLSTMRLDSWEEEKQTARGPIDARDADATKEAADYRKAVLDMRREAAAAAGKAFDEEEERKKLDKEIAERGLKLRNEHPDKYPVNWQDNDDKTRYDQADRDAAKAILEEEKKKSSTQQPARSEERQKVRDEDRPGATLGKRFNEMDAKDQVKALEQMMTENGERFIPGSLKKGEQNQGAMFSVDVPIATASTIVVPSKADGMGAEARDKVSDENRLGATPGRKFSEMSAKDQVEALERMMTEKGERFIPGSLKKGEHNQGAFFSVDVPIETGSTIVVPSKAEGTGMEADGGKAATGVENKSTERGRQASAAEPAASVKQTDGGDVPPEPYKGSQREARDKVAGSLALAAEKDRLSYFDKHDAWKQTHMEADGKGHPDKTSIVDNYNPKLDEAAYRDQKGKLLTQREMGTLSAIAGEEVQKIQADPEAKSLSKGEIAERLKEGVMRRLQEIAEKKDGRDGLAEFRKESLDYASRLFDRPETREAVQSLQATANGPGSLRGAGVKEPTAGDKEVAAGASKDVEGELRQQAGAMAPPKFGFEAATNVQVPAGGGAMPSKGTVRMP